MIEQLEMKRRWTEGKWKVSSRTKLRTFQQLPPNQIDPNCRDLYLSLRKFLSWQQQGRWSHGLRTEGMWRRDVSRERRRDMMDRSKHSPSQVINGELVSPAIMIRKRERGEERVYWALERWGGEGVSSGSSRCYHLERRRHKAFNTLIIFLLSIPSRFIIPMLKCLVLLSLLLQHHRQETPFFSLRSIPIPPADPKVIEMLFTRYFCRFQWAW